MQFEFLTFIILKRNPLYKANFSLGGIIWLENKLNSTNLNLYTLSTQENQNLLVKVKVFKTKLIVVWKIHRITKDSPISDDQIRIFKDEGFSGGNMERPEFQKMMDLCHSKSENIKAVVCYKLDRFSRSISDFSAAFDELNKMRIEFISVSDDFDTTTAAGKAVIMLVTVFAEFERNILAERIRDNKEGLAKTGRWLGGMTQ